MKKQILIASVLVLSLGLGCAGSQSAGPLDLAGLVGEKLGLTSAQTTAGLGALFSLAQGKLPAEQFSSLTSSIPGAQNYIKQATDMGAISGPVTSAAEVTSTLTKMGVDAGKAASFIPAVVDVTKGAGLTNASNLLAGLV
jgi:hypothetical protein